MRKLRCAILDDYQQVALASADWTIIQDHVEPLPFHQRLTGVALVQALLPCEIAIAMRERTPFNAPLFARLPNLKLLITTGMRNASIDLAAASAYGVMVCGTGSRSEPPAELTWALILGLARQIVPENLALRSGGPWQQTVGMDLHGRRLGLLGLGKIGSQVARVGLAFGMDVLAWSQNLTSERAAEVGVRLAASKEELLESSDILSIHLVLSARTRGLIGERELRRMRPAAFLINTSRAAIVNQAALEAALRENRLAGAGLDVFDEEPLPSNHPFRTLPNVLATPHLGYVTQGNYHVYYQEAVEDIAAYLAAAPIRRIA